MLWGTPSAALAIEDASPSASVVARVPHEVLVGFKSDSTRAERRRLLNETEAESVEAIPGIEGGRLISLEGGQTVAEAIADLKPEGEVAWVQPNVIGRISEVPDDPGFGHLWAFRNTGQMVEGVTGTTDADTDIDEAWDIDTGSGARVAVVDTGIDPTSPDLSAAMNQTLSRNFAASIQTGVVDSSDWQDQNGHGTHVAGTIAAAGNNGIGVAGSSWNTDLVAVRACDFDGYCDASTVASALAYAGGVGAKLVNVSLGFGGTAAEASVLRAAMEQNPGTLYVVAAGNESVNVEEVLSWPCDLDLENVICVAATDQNDHLAGFSNFGPTSVDLAAPGANILSTVPRISAKTDKELAGGLAGWSQTPGGSWTLGALEGGGSYIRLNVSGTAASATLTAPELDFSDGRSCSATYYLSARLRIGQSLSVQLSTDGGTTWQTPGPYGPITSQSGIDDQEFHDLSSWFGAADGESDVSMRFRYSSLGTSLQAPTVSIASPLVKCIEAQPVAGTYAIFSGTSMATPQVTGTAALVAGIAPELGTDGLRSVTLDSVDELASLNGRTVTGGRLNAYGAMVAAGGKKPAEGNGPMGEGDGLEVIPSDPGTIRILSVKRLNRGRARVRVRVTKAGRVWIKGTRKVKARSRRVSGPSTLKLTVVPRRKVERSLRRGSRQRVRLTIGYRPSDGSTLFRNRRVTLVSR